MWTAVLSLTPIDESTTKSRRGNAGSGSRKGVPEPLSFSSSKGSDENRQDGVVLEGDRTANLHIRAPPVDVCVGDTSLYVTQSMVLSTCVFVSIPNASNTLEGIGHSYDNCFPFRALKL